MKIVNIDGELSYFPNDLRKFNEIFRKAVPYDNIKSHKKTRAAPSLSKIHFWKNHKDGQIDPSLPAF